MTGYFNLINPVVFIDTVFVYSQPDTSSEIITKLQFNTPLDLAIGDYVSHSDYWNTIKLGDQTAYIPAYSVAAQKFISNSQGKDYTYFIVNNYDKIAHTPVRGFTVYKYDIQQKRFIDSLRTEYMSAHIAKELNHTAWKNVDFLLFTQEIRAYCGGGESEYYIIDANGKLQILINTGVYNDDGEEETTMGSIVKFPKNVATDTIKYTKFKNKNVFNKKGMLIKNKDGSPKRTGVDSIKYFMWNGKSLVKLEEEIKVE